ncbi:MAG TPA: hypothetical protein VFD58_26545 [Blastocatellia bacterium]|nr:hypothetical protein [Blastocatellia bacterium]
MANKKEKPQKNLELDDLLLLLYVRAMLDSFRINMLNYFAAATTSKQKQERALKIREIITKNSPKGFSPAAEELPGEAYSCPPGFVCVDGICVPRE